MKAYSYVLVLTVVLMVAGCSSKKNQFESREGSPNQIFTQSAEEIQKSDDDSKEKAERFALLGQTALESPKASHLAIQAFEEALKLDGYNARANFYSALLLPVLSLKGLPMMMSEILTPKYTQEIIDSTLKGIRDESIRLVVSDLMKDGKAGAVFKTPSEFQQFITAQFLPTLEESQRRLEVVSKSADFKVTFDFGHWGRRRSLKTTVTLDHVEANSAKTAMKGVSVWAKIISAYNFDDALSLRDKYMAKDRESRRQMTFKDVVDDIKQYPRLLAINSNGADLLRSARESISDTSEGIKIVANMLGTNRAEREGKLIPAFDEYEQYFGCRAGSCMVNDILSGPFAAPFGKKKRQERTVLLDGTVVFYRPIADLKALLPTEFDASGKLAKTFPDVHFGGIVPNGDLLSTYCSMSKETKNVDLPVVCPEEKKTN